MKILIGTSNLGKVSEYKSLLGSHFEPIPLTDLGIRLDVEETGSTYSDNALIKLNFLRKRTKLPIITDDSGLEVEALKGEPGIYSARYSGKNASDDNNIDKLLLELGSSTNRKAKFVCCIAFSDTLDANNITFAHGECIGKIITQRMGSGGFGYDPIFYVEKFGKTLAELSKEEKNSISHRQQAVRNLLKRINI